MKLGAVFPVSDLTDPLAIRDYAQALEELGFDYLLTYEHVLGANPQREGGWQGPYTYTDSFFDPFTLFSYLAGITEKLAFATGILILPQRQTALVAKQAACLDVLCGGRLRLGIGVGWNKVEYQALGEDFHQRGQRVDEQVRLLQDLWTKPLVTFEGDFHHIPDAGLNPLPVQRPIPLWFGGGAEVVLRRMARYGAGWMPASAPVEKLRPQLDALKGYLSEAGRSTEDFGIDVRLNIHTQAPETWQSYIEAWQAEGMTHLAINTMGGDGDHIAALERANGHLK